MSPTTTKQNLKKLRVSKSICMTRKPPGPGERYIEPLLLLQEADAGGAGPHTGDHDDVPLSALEPVHSVHRHLWRKGQRYHEEKYWTAAPGREKKYWTILHLGGREVGILQSKSQLLSLLGIERDHLFIHSYESSSNTSQPFQLQDRLKVTELLLPPLRTAFDSTSGSLELPSPQGSPKVHKSESKIIFTTPDQTLPLLHSNIGPNPGFLVTLGRRLYKGGVRSLLSGVHSLGDRHRSTCKLDFTKDPK